MFTLNVYGLLNNTTRRQTTSRRMDAQTGSNELERQWKEAKDN
jgi:hypothetical protein